MTDAVVICFEHEFEPRTTHYSITSEKESKVADSSNAKISRRSARAFTEEQHNMGTPRVADSRLSAYCDENEIDKHRLSRASRSSSLGLMGMNDAGLVRRVNLGKDMSAIFPKTHDEVQKQVAKSVITGASMLLEAEANNGESKRLNLGTVVPGIYRSSFPQTEDHEYLRTLNLKTIVTLVKKDYPDGYIDFIKANGIRHHTIEMAGTKKEAIPRSTMRSIMKIVLDKANYPILIHCNKGRHRTGCTAAVFRHLSGWKVEDIVSEYKQFADGKVREVDIAYIEAYRVSDMEGLFIPKVEQPVLLRAKMFKFFLVAVFLIFLCYFYPPPSFA